MILSLVTDQVLHVLKVYPPWGEPMWDPGLNFLALSYRIVYTVLGGYLAARFAPRSPMRHAFVLAVIGLPHGRHGCHRHERHGLRSTLVSNRDRSYRVALHMAGRTVISRKASRTIGRLTDAPQSREGGQDESATLAR